MADEIYAYTHPTDTAANWAAGNRVLALGEVGYDTTNNQLRAGNGIDPWSMLTPIAAGAAGTVDQTARDLAQSALNAATAKYTKPSGGIPQTDLDNATAVKIDAGATAYQKPAGGIPDADLASTFIKTVNGNQPDSNGNIVVSGGGSGGAVTSVAGKTGDVTLNKSDVGLANVSNTSDANKPVSTAQQAALDAKAAAARSILPGTGLTGGGDLTADRTLALNAATQASLARADTALQTAPVTSVAGKTGAVTLAKADVGLGNVDNTADASKPVSSAQAAAISAAAFTPAPYATTVPYLSPDGTYEYEVTTVRAPNGSMLSAIEKVYPNDYERTWTSGTFSPPAQAFSAYQDQAGAYVVLSADAFQGGQMAGLQIKNGTLYRGWGNYSNDTRIGQEAVALMKDGSWAAFTKSGYPDPSSVVAAGAHTTWGFGPLVVVNGAVRSGLDDSFWGDWASTLSARHILGYTARGDMVSILVKGASGSSGIKGSELGNVALRHGCVNAIMLDGGGSTQGIARHVFHPSSDTGGNRDVWNAIAVRAPLVKPITVPETAATYTNGFAPTSTATGNEGTLSATKRDGRVTLRGTANTTAAVTANTWYQVAVLPSRLRPKSALASYRGAVYTNNVGQPGVVSIGSDGVVQVKSPVAASSGTYWQLDGASFDADY